MTGNDSAATGEHAEVPSAFTRCSQCSMQLRRSEMDIHLAHSHNIGPSTGKKDRGRDGRGKRRRFGSE